jgi:hypothetical protein
MNNMRDFADPKNSKRYLPNGQPNTYGGTYWQAGYNDPHINAGIIAYWFYLLVNGGSGTNDHGTAYTVQGIGIDKAVKIFQRTLIISNPQSDCFQTAALSLLAASSLYGANSNEGNQVKAAWRAVGITPGSLISGPDVVPCISGTATYSLPNELPVPTWSVSSNLQIESAPGAKTILVKAKQSTSSTIPGTITVSLERNGIYFSSKKEVTILQPPVVTSITGSSTVQAGGYGVFTASPNFPASQGRYEWYVSPSTGVQFAGYSYTCNITFNTPGTYTVFCRSRNNCNSPGSYNASKIVTVTSGSGYYSATVPNNSKLVNISYSAKPGSTLSKQTVDYALVNSATGSTVASGRFPATGGTLDFSAQPAGIYLLQITNDKGGIETFKIILK